jgi:hypothetical protein
VDLSPDRGFSARPWVTSPLKVVVPPRSGANLISICRYDNPGASIWINELGDRKKLLIGLYRIAILMIQYV